MTMLSIRDQVIHMEPSSRCTLACLECPRTIHSGEYEVGDCDVDLMADHCARFDTVMLCGNHGDPIYHPRFIDLIRSIRQRNRSVSFVIDTNGSFRSTRWWTDLAAELTEKDTVIFSIDGMPWNYHLYRVNSDWKSIESGIIALREKNQSVHLCWKWILFRYNQDEVISGISMATDLGFDSFALVYSARYGLHDHLIPTRSNEDIEMEINQWAQSHQDAS